MMKMNQSNEKVVEFAQNSLKAKTFRQEYPMSLKLKQVIIGEVFSDFMKYTYCNYFDEYSPMLTEFSLSHEVCKEKREALEENVFWWRLFFDINLKMGRNCVKEFILNHFEKLVRMPLVLSWLRECEKAIPKFYHVGHKYDDRVLILTDILTKKPLNVVIYDSQAMPTAKDEIVAGTLLPLGGEMYFPVIDFYHFDISARFEIIRHLYYYYDKFLRHSSLHEAFIYVLSGLLQVENLVLEANKHSAS